MGWGMFFSLRVVMAGDIILQVALLQTVGVAHDNHQRSAVAQTVERPAVKVQLSVERLTEKPGEFREPYAEVVPTHGNPERSLPNEGRL
jgi:hypothetical protein